jgi:hypothetical protein
LAGRVTPETALNPIACTLKRARRRYACDTKSKSMRYLFLLWLVFLVCLSLSPFEVKAELHSMGRYHNLGHFVAFTITTAWLAWNARTLAGRAALSLVAVGIALGTELLERFRFHNPYEWRDAYTDCAGVLFGFVIVSAASSFLRSKRLISQEE